MDVILALDTGSQSSRAAVYNEKFECLYRSEKYRLAINRADEGRYVTSKVEDIIASGLNALNDAADYCRKQAYRVITLGITNQRETFCAWKETGDGKMEFWEDAISWQAFHCELYPKTLTWPEDLKDAKDREARLANRITDRTGLPHSVYFSATKMHWFATKSIKSWDKVRLGTVDTLFTRLLTGEFKTDITNAHRTNLLNIRKGAWSQELLSIWGIPREALATVQPSCGRFGTIIADKKAELYTVRKLDESLMNVPVSALIGDQQSSSLAHGLARSSSVKLTLGTGAFLSARIHRLEDALEYAATIVKEGKVPSEAFIQVTPMIGYNPSKEFPEGRTIYMAENYCKAAGIGINNMVKMKIINASSEFDEAAGKPFEDSFKFADENLNKWAQKIFTGQFEDLMDQVPKLSKEDIRYIVRKYVGLVMDTLAVNVEVFAKYYKFDGSTSGAGFIHKGEIENIYVDGGLLMSNVIRDSLKKMWGEKVSFRRDPEMTVLGAAIAASIGSPESKLVYSLEAFQDIVLTQVESKAFTD